MSKRGAETQMSKNGGFVGDGTKPEADDSDDIPIRASEAQLASRRIKTPRSMTSRRLQAPQRSQASNVSIDPALLNGSGSQTNGFARTSSGSGSAVGAPGGPPQQGHQFHFFTGGNFAPAMPQASNPPAAASATSSAASATASFPSAPFTFGLSQSFRMPATPAVDGLGDVDAPIMKRRVVTPDRQESDTVPQWASVDGKTSSSSCSLADLSDILEEPKSSDKMEITYPAVDALDTALESSGIGPSRVAFTVVDNTEEVEEPTDVTAGRPSEPRVPVELFDSEMESVPMDSGPATGDVGSQAQHTDSDMEDRMPAPASTSSIFSQLASNTSPSTPSSPFHFALASQRPAVPAKEQVAFPSPFHQTPAGQQHPVVPANELVNSVDSHQTQAGQQLSVAPAMGSVSSANLNRASPTTVEPQSVQVVSRGGDDGEVDVDNTIKSSSPSTNTSQHTVGSTDDLIVPTAKPSPPPLPPPTSVNPDDNHNHVVGPTEDVIATIMPPSIPSHFTEMQRHQFVFAFRLRCVDAGLKVNITDASAHAEFDSLLGYYNNIKSGVYSAAGLKRKAIEADLDDDQTLQSKRINVDGPIGKGAASRAPVFGFPTASKRKSIDEAEESATDFQDQPRNKKQRSADETAGVTKTPTAPPPSRSLFDRIEMDDQGNPRREAPPESATEKSKAVELNNLFPTKFQKAASSSLFGQSSSSQFASSQNTSRSKENIFSQPDASKTSSVLNTTPSGSSIFTTNNTVSSAHNLGSSQSTTTSDSSHVFLKSSMSSKSPSGDRTWDQQSPIKFGASSTSNTFSRLANNTSLNTPTTTAASPVKSAPTTNIFGHLTSGADNSSTPAIVTTSSGSNTNTFGNAISTSASAGSTAKQSSAPSIFDRPTSTIAPTSNISGHLANSGTFAQSVNDSTSTSNTLSRPAVTSSQTPIGAKAASPFNLFGPFPSTITATASTNKPASSSIFAQSTNKSAPASSETKPASTSIFGQPTSTSALSSSEMKPASASIFGQSTSTNAPASSEDKPGLTSSIFNKSADTKFPTATTSSLFGQPAKSSIPPSSSTSSPFGQPPKTSAPTFTSTTSLFGQSPKPSTLTSDPSKNASTFSLFGQSAKTSMSSEASKPALTSSLFGRSAKSGTPTSEATKPAPTFSLFGQSVESSTSASEAAKPALSSSIFGSLKPPGLASVDTSRATSPGVTTGEESNTDGDQPADSPKDEQLDLSNANTGEEDEDLLFQIKTKASELAAKAEGEQPSWNIRGIGELRLLKNRKNGTTRVVLRAGPAAKIVLNTSLFGAAKYDTASDKLVNFPVASANGVIKKWLLQVGKKEDATKLSELMENNKSA